MAREKAERFIGQGAASVPDPGLKAMQDRVAAQREALAAEQAETAKPAAKDDLLIAAQRRVKSQRDAARKAHADADKAALKSLTKSTPSSGE